MKIHPIAAKGIPVFVSALMMQGCAIHPAIDDVTPYNAYDIVRKTRCEAREALISKLTQYLARQHDDPAALAIASDLRQNPDSINNSDFRSLSKNVKYTVDYVGRSAVAFDFSLNITENNSASGDASIVKLFPSGTRSLGLSAASNLTRNNLSTFFVTDTFINLLKNVEPIYCYKYNFDNGTYTKLDTASKNYVYPMAGNIGISKSIDVFVNMSLFGNLTGKEKGPPTMSDALEFTTRFTGSTTPALTFLPGAPGTRLASLSIAGTSYREDKHKVIIGLSLPLDDPKVPNATDVFTGQIVTLPQKVTPAEVRAGNAVSQHILRFEIGQRNPTPVIVQSILPLL